jgi:hypothetical protein
VVAAGGRIYATDVNRRVGTTTATSNGTATSGTTELVVDTVTASVVSGRRYRIKATFPHQHSVANDRFFLLIREGTTTGGTQLTYNTTFGHTTGQADVLIIETDWTAPAPSRRSAQPRSPAASSSNSQSRRPGWPAGSSCPASGSYAPT